MNLDGRIHSPEPAFDVYDTQDRYIGSDPDRSSVTISRAIHRTATTDRPALCKAPGLPRGLVLRVS